MNVKALKKKALSAKCSKRRGAKRKRPVDRRAGTPAIPPTIPTATDEYGFLTSREVLGILRISAATLRNMMQARALPYLRLGRKALFRKKDLDTFIASRTVK